MFTAFTSPIPGTPPTVNPGTYAYIACAVTARGCPACYVPLKPFPFGGTQNTANQHDVMYAKVSGTN